MGYDNKPWWASRTIWVGIIGALFGILAALNVLPEGLSQDSIVEGVLAVTGILAVVFRVGASKNVGSGG